MRRIYFILILFNFINFPQSIKAQLWLDVGGGVDGEINGSYIDSISNLLYVVGNFHSAGGVPANQIAVWDSLHWMSFGDNSEFKNPGVISSVIKYNGEIIVAGFFDSIGNKPIQNIARWDGNEWQLLGANFDYSVYALEIYNGSLYAGGSFFRIGSDTIPHIAKWDGNRWTRVGDGLDNSVLSFCVYKSKLICGGVFSSSGIESIPRIASWNDTAFSHLGAGFKDPVFRVRVLLDTLYAMGDFHSWSANPSNYISKWDGVSWQEMPYPTGGQNSILDACIFNNHFYVVGYFTNPPDLAILNGNQYDSLGNIVGFATSYTIYKNELYVLGSYISISNNLYGSIAKLNSMNIGIQELNKSLTNFCIYPNPTTLRGMKIKISDPTLILDHSLVSLFSMDCRLVLKGEIENENTISWQENKVVPGLYFLKIISHEQMFYSIIQIKND